MLTRRSGILFPYSLDCEMSFARPAFLRALSIIHSICPLVLRNSSAAHFSIALSVSGSILSTKGFFFDIIIGVMYLH